MTNVIARCQALARNRSRRVALPESTEPRVLEAADRLRRDGIAEIVLIGAAADVGSAAQRAGISLDGFTILDPAHSDYLEPFAMAYANGPRRTDIKIARRLLRRPLFFGGMAVSQHIADCMVAGAVNPTSRVIEAGQMTIGLAADIHTPSSYFLMVVPNFDGRSERTFVYADCAVNIEPDAEQLADIAIASAASASKLLDEPIRVAMLSFSTTGSAQHSNIDKVTEAVAIANQRAPGIAIDGEFQADSALIPRVAEHKVNRDSSVAGQANVLIFPSLESGNIAYKLTQYMANARAIGPFLQGFAKPVSDLSRGATVEDIVDTVTVAVTQAD